MTTGEVLIKNLKLSSFKDIKILKIIGFPVSLYYIFYCSRAVQFPITLPWIYKAFNQKYFNLYNGVNLQKYILSPPLDLKEFNGNQNSKFIVVDLSGIWFQDLSKFKESEFSFKDKILELLNKNKILYEKLSFTRKAKKYKVNNEYIEDYEVKVFFWGIKFGGAISQTIGEEDLKDSFLMETIVWGLKKYSEYAIDELKKRYSDDWKKYVNFKEALTWRDLQKSKGVSPFTNFYRKERVSLGNTVSKIRFVGSNIVNNDVDINFFIKATLFNKDKNGNIVGQKYPDKKNLVTRSNDKDVVENGLLVKNPDKMYHVTIRFLDFIKNYINLYGKVIVKNEDIKKVIMGSFLELNSDNPSFLYQGMQYNCGLYGGAINKRSVKKPKFWTSKIHGSSFYFLDKDFQEVVNSIFVFMNSICASVKNQLRTKGFE